jgi:hypothetical protein
VKSFKDKSGRIWQIELTYGLMQQIKNDLGFDLLAGNAEDSARLSFDIPSFINVLFLCCEDQAKEHGITDQDFGKLFASNVLKDAFEAFRAEHDDFFQFSPEAQKVLRAAMGKMHHATQMAADMMIEKLNSEETTDSMRAAMASHLSTPGLTATA